MEVTIEIVRWLTRGWRTLQVNEVKGTRCGGLRVGFSAAVHLVGGSELVKASDLALIEGVFWELLREADEDGFALLDAAVAEFADG